MKTVNYSRRNGKMDEINRNYYKKQKSNAWEVVWLILLSLGYTVVLIALLLSWIGYRW